MKESRAKILIVDDNCAQLIALTIWLTQFPQLQVQGNMYLKSFREHGDLVFANGYDLIIFGMEIDQANEFPINQILALASIRKAKEEQNKPAIIMLADGWSGQHINNAYKSVNQQLLKESDGRVYLADSLLDFHIEINRILSYRRAISKLDVKAG